MGPQVGGEAGGLGAQGLLGPARQRERQRVVRGSVGAVPLLPRLVRRRGFLQDHVGVGTADAERRHTGPARAVGGLGPLAGLGQQLHRSGRPVDVRGRLVDVQGLRQHAVPHRLDHLDDAAHAGGSLRVADVRLQRAEKQRVRAVLAVGGEEGLGLDGVAQAGAGAVGFDGVDVGGGESGVGQGLADDAFLGGAVGGGEAVGGAVLVDGAAADDGEYRVAVAPGLRQALHQQDADPFGPAGAIRRRGERLAAAVRGQSPLAAELDEDLRGRHQSHPAGQCEVALATPQGGGGQMQGDQGRGASRVHRERRALQPEGVRDPAGGHAAGAARAEVPLDLLRDGAEPARVVVEHDTGEHAGPGGPDGLRPDPGAFERLPGGLQQQPLLRVHRQRLTRADPEELGVEVGAVVEEAALADVGGARGVLVVREQRAGVPAPVVREGADGVAALGDQPPQALRRIDAARVAAAHGDDRQGLVGGGTRAGRGGAGHRSVEEQGEQVVGQAGGCGPVEDEGGRQGQAQSDAEAVAQADGRSGVQAVVLERAIRVERPAVALVQHTGRLLPHQGEDEAVALLGRQGSQPGGEGRGVSGVRGGRPGGSLAQ